MADENTPVVPPATPWFGDLDDTHREFVTSKGWDKLDPAGAAKQAVVAYRMAQQAISARQGGENAVRIPTDPNDAAGWTELHKRLGRPDKPEDYKIENLAFADGTAPDGTFIGHMRALAHELNLPADKAQALASRVMAIADEDARGASRDSETQKAANDVELRRAWGGNHDFFRFQTSRAAQLLGVPESVVTAMESRPTADYLKFMDGLRSLAGKMGEAELLRSDGSGGSVPNLTREEAVERIAALKKDESWTKRFLSGDTAARTEFENLTRVMVGPPPTTGPVSPFARR